MSPNRLVRNRLRQRLCAATAVAALCAANAAVAAGNAPPLEQGEAARARAVAHEVRVLPAPQRLDERLRKLGLALAFVNVVPYTDDDAQFSDGSIQKGDVGYRFVLADVPADGVADCPIVGVFEIRRRGDKWIPTSRTANFLLRNSCAEQP